MISTGDSLPPPPSAITPSGSVVFGRVTPAVGGGVGPIVEAVMAGDVWLFVDGGCCDGSIVVEGGVSTKHNRANIAT